MEGTDRVKKVSVGFEKTEKTFHIVYSDNCGSLAESTISQLSHQSAIMRRASEIYHMNLRYSLEIWMWIGVLDDRRQQLGSTVATEAIYLIKILGDSCDRALKLAYYRG